MWAGEKKKVDRKKFVEERKTGQVRVGPKFMATEVVKRVGRVR